MPHPDAFPQLDRDAHRLSEVVPSGTEHMQWTHALLIPEAPTTEKARAHWDKSFRLIEEGVFQAEDLFVVGEIQAGLATGALTHLTFGGLETPVAWFHANVDAAIAASGGLPATRAQASTRLFRDP